MGEVKLVPFTKTAETEDGLIAKLSARGLVFSDESELRSLLRTIGYYRMSGYLHSFRQPATSRPTTRGWMSHFSRRSAMCSRRGQADSSTGLR